MPKYKQYKQKFRHLWLTDEMFENWLKPVEGNNMKAHCMFCKCDMNAKYTDLKLHMKSKKHIKATSVETSPIILQSYLPNEVSELEGEVAEELVNLQRPRKEKQVPAIAQESVPFKCEKTIGHLKKILNTSINERKEIIRTNGEPKFTVVARILKDPIKFMAKSETVPKNNSIEEISYVTKAISSVTTPSNAKRKINIVKGPCMIMEGEPRTSAESNYDEFLENIVENAKNVFGQDLKKYLQKNSTLLESIKRRSDFTKDESGVKRLTKLLVNHLSHQYFVELAVGSWKCGKDSDSTSSVTTRLESIEHIIEQSAVEVRNIKVKLEEENDHWTSPAITLDSINIDLL